MSRQVWKQLSVCSLLAATVAMIGLFCWIVAWPWAIVQWKLRPLVVELIWKDGALRNKDVERRVLEMGPAFAAAIIEMLEDETEDVQFRRNAATALQSLFMNESPETAPYAARVIPHLARILGDPKKPLDLRVNAGEALASVEGNKTAIVPKLITILQDPIADVRNWAMTILSDVGPDAVSAVPRLIELLGSEDVSTRYVAARTIPVVDPAQTRAAVRTLCDIIANRDLNWEIRWESMSTLGAFGPDAEAAVPTLIELLGAPARLSVEERENGARLSRELQLAEAACRSLVEIGPAAKDAVPAIINLMTDLKVDDSMKRRIIATLQKIDPVAAAPAGVK